VKLEDHVLKACKYAQQIVQEQGVPIETSQFPTSNASCPLSATNPWAAQAVADMIDALAEN
jgi:hypothetical protein